MFDAIKKLFSKSEGGMLSGLSGNSGGSVCGIDIGSGSIKVVQAKEEKGKNNSGNIRSSFTFAIYERTDWKTCSIVRG
jgi:hypothetical protein